jgi:hypothetical protein
VLLLLQALLHHLFPKRQAELGNRQRLLLRPILKELHDIMNIGNKTFIGAFAVDLLTGAIISQGAGGDAAKEAAKAEEVLGIVGGFQQIVAGNAAVGINSVAAAVEGSKTLSPAESMAVQNLIALAGNNAALISNVVSGTIMGQAEAALVNNLLTEMTNVCQSYIAKKPA